MNDLFPFFFLHAGAIVVTSAVAELCQSRDSARVDNHIGVTITRDYARASAMRGRKD